MNSIKRQIGGFYNTAFLLLCLGGAVLLTLNIGPVYMNEGKAAKIVSQVASQPTTAKASIQQIRSTLQKRWNVDDVKHLDYKEVKLKKSKTGKSLYYKYEVRKPLFSGISIVVSFEKDYPIARGA